MKQAEVKTLNKELNKHALRRLPLNVTEVTLVTMSDNIDVARSKGFISRKTSSNALDCSTELAFMRSVVDSLD